MNTNAEDKMFVAFTFEDATKDHAEYATRILEKYGYRGIFNVVTDVIGRDETFLTWDDVRDLLARGHEIAAHGMEYHSGPNPDSLLKKWNRGEKDEVWHQIIGSREAIEKETGKPVKYFCFPHNAANRGILRMVKKARMIPLRCSRPNFGGDGQPWTITSPGAWIDREVAKGKRYGALMFHGIVRRDKGFAPFDDEDGSGFERCVREVKERDGKSVRVVKYSDVEWPTYEHRPLWPRIMGRVRKVWCCFFL